MSYSTKFWIKDFSYYYWNVALFYLFFIKSYYTTALTCVFSQIFITSAVLYFCISYSLLSGLLCTIIWTCSEHPPRLASLHYTTFLLCLHLSVVCIKVLSADDLWCLTRENKKDRAFSTLYKKDDVVNEERIAVGRKIQYTHIKMYCQANMYACYFKLFVLLKNRQ